jgi:AcrR family transcriptional regulator
VAGSQSDPKGTIGCSNEDSSRREARNMNHDDRVSAADRKEQIIEKATMLFYTNGYDNTSIRELAKATGLSVAGVYYFFKDKEEILFSILIQSINDLNDTILSAINEKDDPKKNLKRIIRKLLSHNIKQKGTL